MIYNTSKFREKIMQKHTLANYSAAPGFIKDFLTYLLIVKGRSELTVINYYADLRTFVRFLKMQKNPELVNKAFTEIDIEESDKDLAYSAGLDEVQQFLIYITQKKANQSKARARKAVVLRQYYKYLTHTRRIFEVNPLDNLELPSPKPALPKHLSLEQSIELVSFAGKEKELPKQNLSFRQERDYCMLIFLINCGMRLNELTGIDRNSVYINGNNPANSFVKVLGKGNKERIIYLNEMCINAYNAYIKKLNSEENFNSLKKTDALFVSNQFKRISNRRVEQIIDEYLSELGLAQMGLSVHKLRHTAATLMYQNGVDVRVLKEILGHENLNTTQIYTHVANQQIQDAMSKNPLNSISSKNKKEAEKE